MISIQENFTGMLICKIFNTVLTIYLFIFFNREFHYGPDPDDDGHTESDSDNEVKRPTTPPESTFRKLAPSKNRYTLLNHDEL